MSSRAPIRDERLAEMRDPTLRALTVIDSLEPSRKLDRAVLGLAREATKTEARRAGSAPRGPRGAPPALRWGFPAAIAAAAVCAIVSEHGMSSRSEPPRAAAQRLIEPTQTAQSRWLIPTFIEASAPAFAIRVAPQGKRASEEGAPRAPVRSPQRTFPMEREWTARRPFLIEDLTSSSDGSPPLPPRQRGNPGPPEAAARARASAVRVTAHPDPR